MMEYGQGCSWREKKTARPRLKALNPSGLRALSSEFCCLFFKGIPIQADEYVYEEQGAHAPGKGVFIVGSGGCRVRPNGTNRGFPKRRSRKHQPICLRPWCGVD